ncbi:hypothetical protein DFAR_1980007 [Desulfarculales bacterium]
MAVLLARVGGADYTALPAAGPENFLGLAGQGGAGPETLELGVGPGALAADLPLPPRWHPEPGLPGLFRQLHRGTDRKQTSSSIGHLLTNSVSRLCCPISYPSPPPAAVSSPISSLAARDVSRNETQWGIFDQAGRLVAVQSVGRDITERKQQVGKTMQIVEAQPTPAVHRRRRRLDRGEQGGLGPVRQPRRRDDPVSPDL